MSVQKDGRVKAWAIEGTYGVLASSPPQDQAIEIPAMTDAKEICANGVMLTHAGRIWRWSTSGPENMPPRAHGPSTVTHLGCGDPMLTRRSDGSVWVWGGRPDLLKPNTIMFSDEDRPIRLTYLTVR